MLSGTYQQAWPNEMLRLLYQSLKMLLHTPRQKYLINCILAESKAKNDSRAIQIAFASTVATSIYTLPKTSSSPLKIGRAPKGNDRIPTIHFQVESWADFSKQIKGS